METVHSAVVDLPATVTVFWARPQRDWHQQQSLVDRYDPATDQFLSVDPDVAETGQPYAFTGDDPLNATDPLGLKRVYVITNREGRIKYVGQTGDNGNRRRSAHGRSGQYDKKAGDEFEYLKTGSLSDIEATGVEQQVIDTFGLKGGSALSGQEGILDNKINAVGNPSQSSRWTSEQVEEAGSAALQANPDADDQINALAQHVGYAPDLIPEFNTDGPCLVTCGQAPYIGGSAESGGAPPDAISADIDSLEYRVAVSYLGGDDD